MMEPDSGLVRLSPAQLTRIRRCAGDHSDRTLIEACAIGLAYWATGRGPAGTDLTPGTPFTDVLGLVDNGVTSPRGWEADAEDRSVTVPKGVDRAEAQLVLGDLACFPDRPIGTLAQGVRRGSKPWPSGTTPGRTGSARPSWSCSVSRRA